MRIEDVVAAVADDDAVDDGGGGDSNHMHSTIRITWRVECLSGGAFE